MQSTLTGAVDISRQKEKNYFLLEDLETEAIPSLTNKKQTGTAIQLILKKISLNVLLKTYDQIENDAKMFTEQLQQAVKANTPIIKKVASGRNYSIEVKEFIREKWKARRSWQKSRDPERKTIFNRINQKLKRLTHEIKNQKVARYLQGLTAEKDTNYSLWKETKSIKRPIINAPPIRIRCELLKSYLQDRCFRVRYEDTYFSFRKIAAGVPQGSVLGPTLYLLYTADIPRGPEVRVATFTDDTAILATGDNTVITTTKLQRALNRIVEWTKQWRIKLNESKSQHINFTLKKEAPLPITINQQVVPYSNSAKYLGMTLDVKLRWKEHVKIKRKQLNNMRSKMEWMIGRNSKLSVHNKLMLYKQILKPVWTYGIQLWGCSADSNIKIIQVF
ncbi:rna-directed dna polymerase from mobile element jockey-like protein [Lasius niger]|uniref:Rna-directed dna polymerase from mobile element jockey-like protein n=1 Tax=Lasius niger TaxID=67767 RepID=A0A0J7KTD3_LASNI|nr:rna-directed dna polymerase from mobile element jockey-like protein [Lasius niger]KMQ93509.1 rna-directed dna polymerase from mobile element jockey-like protein [Lasius niger]KMQ94487.1 rna-directed dna polymerase from mobile element jockey-like protein [Lasius niger]